MIFKVTTTSAILVRTDKFAFRTGKLCNNVSAMSAADDLVFSAAGTIKSRYPFLIRDIALTRYADVHHLRVCDQFIKLPSGKL